MADGADVTTWNQARAVAWEAVLAHLSDRDDADGLTIHPDGLEDAATFLARVESVEHLGGDRLAMLVGGPFVLVEKRGGAATILGNLEGAERGSRMAPVARPSR